MKPHYKTIIIITLAILLASVIAFTGKPQAHPGLDLALQSPSFVQAAAEGEITAAPDEVTSMLTQEAGISAYLQTSNPINLNDVRGLYRTIEAETTDYIIGSVSVPNYFEHFDVHVYVHRDGWILAYYLRDRVTSKIVDVKANTISTNKLETVVSIMAGAVGESSSGLKYYDFRYPNATNILMVAEDNNEDLFFSIKLPSDYIYFERSFSLRRSQWVNGGIDIGGEIQPEVYFADQVGYGPVLASALLPGQTYTVQLRSSSQYYGVLVITYGIPQ